VTAALALAALLALLLPALGWFARLAVKGPVADRVLALHAGLQILAMLIAAASVILARQIYLELAVIVLALAFALAVSSLKLLRYGSLQPRLAAEDAPKGPAP